MTNIRTQFSPATGRMLVLTLLVVTIGVAGCGRRSVVGSAVGAAGTAVGAAGSAVSTAASVTGSAVSGTASAVGALTTPAATAPAATTATAGATAGTTTTASAGSGANVAGAPLALAVGNAGAAIAFDEESSADASAAIAEGVGNCLRGSAQTDRAAGLLQSAGWETIGITNGTVALSKGNVRGFVLQDGNCVFRSDFTTTARVAETLTELTVSLYPGAVTPGTPSGRAGACDGLTVAANRRAWIAYTASNGDTCGGFGAGVSVQFL